MQSKKVQVFQRCTLVSRPILTVYLSQGYDRANVVAKVELDASVLRQVGKMVECRRDRDRFTTAAVPHQRDLLDVDPAVERIFAGLVPVMPLTEMLQQEPGPAPGLGSAQTCVVPGSVKKIFINRNRDVSMACKVLRQISESGLGPAFHQVVAVQDKHQWERALTVRIPDQAIQRQVAGAKAPVARSRPARDTTPVFYQVRTIHCFCEQISVAGIFRVVQVAAGSIA